jgi:hypothetical protein
VNSRKARNLVAGTVVGAVVALASLDPRFIAGTGGKWTHPENDFNAYLVAWHYFVADQWRFPVFDLPQMGYPEGGSILFNDALPVAALPSKILYRLTGLRINPFGWWVFLTYVLQGVMAVRLLSALGVYSVFAALGAAILAVCCVPFMSRLGHVALSSHFLILWALALYFASVRTGRLKVAEQILLSALTLLIQAYLFVIVAVLQLVTLLTLAARRQLLPRDWRLALIGVGAVLATGLAAGYGAIFANPVTMRSGGFGFYSWNLATLFVPDPRVWGLPRGMVLLDATGGQYEGQAYIGLGALLLLVVWVLSARASLVEGVRRHRMLVVALILFAAFAATNRVYLGGRLILSYDLPQRVEEAANYFRASGRFIWPVMYTLILVPIAFVQRKWGPPIATALTLAAILLQVVEAAPTIRSVRGFTAQPLEDLINTDRTAAWMRQHRRVWQYPSWDCGGFERTPRVFGNRESNRELQLQLLAARLALPNNSVYMSRPLKNCRAERHWAAEPVLERDTLYLLGRESSRDSRQLALLVASPACVSTEWGYACSTRWMLPQVGIVSER